MEPQHSGSQILEPTIRKVSWTEIRQQLDELRKLVGGRKVYGVPRGGQIIAGLLGNEVDHIRDCEVIVDDVIDSGKTKETYTVSTGKEFYALYDMTLARAIEWVVFPWEDQRGADSEEVIRMLIKLMGDDPMREGVRDTPGRVLRSFKELYAGYSDDPKRHITTFEKGTYDQMIILKDCEFYSTCEHHLQPFFGKIHIGYVPAEKVIGLSKLARIAECFARRLQIQERIGEQIASFLSSELECGGVGVVIEAKHFCMCARGANKQGSEMVTSSLKGVFAKQEVRSEFLRLIGK